MGDFWCYQHKHECPGDHIPSTEQDLDAYAESIVASDPGPSREQLLAVAEAAVKPMAIFLPHHHDHWTRLHAALSAAGYGAKVQAERAAFFKQVKGKVS